MSDSNGENTVPVERNEQEMNDLFAQRLNKLKELEAAGIDPYGKAFPNTQMIADVRAGFQAPPEGEYGPDVIIAGRLMAKRGMGKSIFADLKDKFNLLIVCALMNAFHKNIKLSPDH